MNLEQIKNAVESGKIVCWSNEGYRVIKDKIGRFFIHCTMNDQYWGLTWQDGVTMNGKEEQFFIKD